MLEFNDEGKIESTKLPTLTGCFICENGYNSNYICKKCRRELNDALPERPKGRGILRG